MRIGVKAFVAAVCLVAATSARGNWERLGPSDGAVTAIAVAADATQPLYALVPARRLAGHTPVDGRVLQRVPRSPFHVGGRSGDRPVAGLRRATAPQAS